MQTEVSVAALRLPRSFQSLERRVADPIRARCAEVNWIPGNAGPGPCDHLDVFEAPDVESARRVPVPVRSRGLAYSQVWPALVWSDFKKVL